MPGTTNTPILSWSPEAAEDGATGYKEARDLIKELMKESAEIASTELSYPLIAFYTGFMQKDEKWTSDTKFKQFRVRSSVLKIFLNAKKHDFPTSFPYVIGDRIVDVGLDKTRKEWIFSPKVDLDKPIPVKKENEKYFLNAIIEFFNKKCPGTKYASADEYIRALCEGRICSASESTRHLYDSLESFFDELKEPKPRHPVDFLIYLQMEKEGEVLWQHYFNNIVKTYNSSFYAKWAARKKDWDALQISEFDETAEDKEKLEVLGEQWIIYSLLADHFVNYSEVETIRTSRITPVLKCVDAEIATMFEWLNNEEYTAAIAYLKDYIGRLSRGEWPPKEADKAKDKVEGTRLLLDAKIHQVKTQLNETEEKVYALLSNIRNYRDYIGEVLDEGDLTTQAQGKIDLWKASLELRKDPGDGLLELKPIEETNEDSSVIETVPLLETEEVVEEASENAKLYAKKTIHFVEAIFGPVDLIIISYALLLVLLRRYQLFFMERMRLSCDALLEKL